MGEQLTTAEAAAELGVNPRTLRRYADRGLVPARTTPGGHRRFDSDDLAPWRTP